MVRRPRHNAVVSHGQETVPQRVWIERAGQVENLSHETVLSIRRHLLVHLGQQPGRTEASEYSVWPERPANGAFPVNQERGRCCCVVAVEVGVRMDRRHGFGQLSVLVGYDSE